MQFQTKQYFRLFKQAHHNEFNNQINQNGVFPRALI
jgi:hypothetical protein